MISGSSWTHYAHPAPALGGYRGYSDVRANLEPGTEEGQVVRGQTGAAGSQGRCPLLLVSLRPYAVEIYSQDLVLYCRAMLLINSALVISDFLLDPQVTAACVIFSL